MAIAPFEYIRSKTGNEGPVLFICDHASNRLPYLYGTLGLPPSLFKSHIAYDIGAADVARALASGFGAPAVHARWSRLLVDLNRGADDPTLVMKLSGGSIIPANATADAGEVELRISQFHEPYHRAIADEIDRFQAAGTVPALISIHSFTPAWKGQDRPWQFGILWDRDDRLAAPLIGALRESGFTVGDNEPYSGELENDCMYRHGTLNGLPHVLIEIRQDLIATQADAIALGSRMKPIVAEALEKMGKPAVRFTRPLKPGGTTMDESTRTNLEAAVFRRLVAHLRERNDVQNIDLMILAGFCRNCLGDWYREAAAEKGISLGKDEAREIVYGMPLPEWKERYQREATPEQQAAFERSQTIHK
jgi:predicted N-formylglutamate amidohydrolase